MVSSVIISQSEQTQQHFQNNNILASNSFHNFDVNEARMISSVTPVAFFKFNKKATDHSAEIDDQPEPKKIIEEKRNLVEKISDLSGKVIDKAPPKIEDVLEDVVIKTNDRLEKKFGTAEIPDEKTINDNLRSVGGVCQKPKVKIVNINNRDIHNFQVELTEPLKCHLVIDNQVFDFTIPAGYKTDLASIPSSVSKKLPPWGDYATAAIIHDYLYDVAPCDENGKQITRAQSDWAFYVCMKELGIKWKVRSLLYAAVRLAGKAPWRRNRENQSQPSYAMAY